MVNVFPPTSSSSSTDKEAIRQLNQKWKQMEALTLSVIRQQEDAQRFASIQSQQSIRRNEDLRRLNRENRLLAAKVQAIEKSVGTAIPSKGENTATAAAAAAINLNLNLNLNLKNKIKKASSQSSSDLTTKLKEHEHTAATASNVKPDVEAPKELPQIPKLDLGCRFIPTDQELIVCLRKKLAGEPLPKFIIERDLYASEEPKHLFRNNPTASEMYFFTPIKIKFDSGKRADRIVGSGTWKLQNNRDVYEDPSAKKTVIGCKRTLNFIEAKNKADSWIMHEYILKGKDEGRWAISRVKRGRGNFIGLSAVQPRLSSTTERAAHQPSMEKVVDQSTGNSADESLELDLKL